MKKISLLSTIFIFLISIYIYNNRKVPIEIVFPGKKWATIYNGVREIKGIGLPNAENCGKCHDKIYKEWNFSTHSKAFTDLQFQSELHKESSPKWLCLNCHIPFQNQRTELFNFLKRGEYQNPIFEHNPFYQKDMENEGVTCATCHVRVNENGEGYILGANGTTSPPHPIQIDRPQLRSVCLNCHQANYQLNDQLVCSFDTANEMKLWQNIRKENKDKDCVSCHLPVVQRSFVTQNLKKNPKESHIHGFIGSGVPKEFSLYKEQIPLGYKRGFDLSHLNFNNNKFKFKIKNKNAGHFIPSGDPERYLALEFTWKGRKEEILSSEIIEIGQKWSWFPKAKKISDNRLLPEEEREFEIISPTTHKPLYLNISIYHVRLREDVMNYMKKTASYLKTNLREKVENIEKNYPSKSLIYNLDYNLEKNTYKEKPIFQ
jgi:hypothetical protein